MIVTSHASHNVPFTCFTANLKVQYKQAFVYNQTSTSPNPFILVILWLKGLNFNILDVIRVCGVAYR